MSSESKAATPEFTNMTWLENSKNRVIFSSWSWVFFERWTYFLAYFERWRGSVGIGEVGHLGRETSTNLHLLGDQLQTLKNQVVDRTKNRPQTLVKISSSSITLPAILAAASLTPLWNSLVGRWYFPFLATWPIFWCSFRESLEMDDQPNVG